MYSRLVVLSVLSLILLMYAIPPASAQSVASGTVEGTVVDPTGGVVSGARVEIRNPISRFSQATTTDSSGMFRFTNLPFNPYHLEVTQPGFGVATEDISVRTPVPVLIKVTLAVAGVTQEVNVEAAAADI